jgi:hypothetical protein
MRDGFSNGVVIRSWRAERGMAVRRGLATVALDGVGEITVAVYSFGGRSWIAPWPTANRRPRLRRAEWRIVERHLDEITSALKRAVPEAFTPSARPRPRARE